MNSYPRIRHWERSYLRTLQELRIKQTNNRWRGNRTGVRTVGGFGLQLDVPLNASLFPALLTKTVHLRSVVAELLWFLKGETNVAYLRENGCTIWDEWATAEGELGPVYGKQWRSWTGPTIIDQVAKLVEDLRERPESRRIIVSAWNPAVLPLDHLGPQDNVELGRQALAPCHMLFQAYVEDLFAAQRLELAEGLIPAGMLAAAQYNMMKPEEVHEMLDRYNIPRRGLSLRVDQRSADWLLGVPFNIASYALLAHLLCTQVDNLAPYRLCMQFGDYHLYENHAEQADEQLRRFEAVVGKEAEQALEYPRLTLEFNPDDERRPLEMWEPENICFSGYEACGPIKAPVAV